MIRRIRQREKVLAVALGGFLGAWLLYSYVVAPAQARIETLQRVIPQKCEQLRQIKGQSQRYRALCEHREQMREALASGHGPGELLPQIEALVKHLELTKHAALLRKYAEHPGAEYGETAVQIEMKAIALKPLVEFLGQFEKPEFVAHVGSFHITPSLSDPDALDAEIIIIRPHLDAAGL